jgi:hypothetical protein
VRECPRQAALHHIFKVHSQSNGKVRAQNDVGRGVKKLAEALPFGRERCLGQVSASRLEGCSVNVHPAEWFRRSYRISRRVCANTGTPSNAASLLERSTGVAPEAPPAAPAERPRTQGKVPCNNAWRSGFPADQIRQRRRRRQRPTIRIHRLNRQDDTTRTRTGPPKRRAPRGMGGGRGSRSL